MIFATFQPIDEFPEKYRRSDDWKDAFYDYLNFNPIWCVNADNLKNFLLGAYLACPCFAEKLIVFESDNYYGIDKRKWTNYLRGFGSMPNILQKEEINEILNTEFLLEKIENIIYEVDIRSKLNNELLYETKQNIENFEYSLKYIKDKNNDEKIIRMETDSYYKNAYIANEYAAIDYKKHIKTSEVFFLDMLKLSDLDGNDKFLDIYNKSGEIEIKINECIVCIESLDKCFSNIKINPNNRCPCGSGKKFKKCCKNIL